MNCPTSCDEDCWVPCHEGHKVTAKRHHDPDYCPGVTTWVALNEYSDDLVGGPFESEAEGEKFRAGDDDIWIAEVSQDWFDRRLAAIHVQAES